jgi:hypothetical protein
LVLHGVIPALASDVLTCGFALNQLKLQKRPANSQRGCVIYRKTIASLYAGICRGLTRSVFAAYVNEGVMKELRRIIDDSEILK